MIDIDSADDRPSFTLDGLTMYFGSRRFSRDPWRVPDNNPQWKWDSDIWYRVFKDSLWSAPINLGQPVNNSGGQINPTVHPRGDLVYYVSGIGGAVFWQAKLVNGKFQDPKPVPGQINGIYQNRSLSAALYMDSVRRISLLEMAPDSDLLTRAPAAYDLHYREHMVKHLQTQGAVNFAQGNMRGESTVTPDGKAVIISENFGLAGHYGLGGMGDEDLWVAPINEQGEWGGLTPLGNNINTAWAETYPFIAADGLTLYFTSNRPCTTCPVTVTGGDDIYRTQFVKDHWTDPVPLGAPFNSPRDDYGFSIGPDGETAYFVSNRSGKSRLYQVSLRPSDSAIAPLPVVIVQGKVTDAVTGRPLHAEIFADDLDADSTRLSVFSDSVSGVYVLAVQRGHRFGLSAVANGYLPRSERFSVPKHQAFDRTKLDLALAPIAVGSTSEFKNVLFETGKATLLKESKLELHRIVQFLERAPATKIIIQGHTDDVGNDAFNQKLSEQRAKSVLAFLVKEGIAASRLSAVGFGKSKPLVPGTDASARAKNRRVEMVITTTQ